MSTLHSHPFPNNHQIENSKHPTDQNAEIAQNKGMNRLCKRCEYACDLTIILPLPDPIPPNAFISIAPFCSLSLSLNCPLKLPPRTFLSAVEAAQQSRLAQEPAAADESNERESSRGPQESLEEMLGAVVGAILDMASQHHYSYRI